MDLQAYLDAVHRLAEAASVTAERLGELRAGDIVLNVHDYALPAYARYLHRHYDDDRPRVAVLSMNPGKHGAVQTGIPFTDVPRARRLVPGFDDLVDRTPIEPFGFAERQEYSGRRVHGWGEQRFGSDAAMLGHVCVLLNCPIAIQEAPPSGNNVPVAALPVDQRRIVMDLVAEHTPRLLDAIDPPGVMLTGRWAEATWEAVLDRGYEFDGRVASCLHPAARRSDDDIVASFDAAYDVAIGNAGPA